MISDAGDFSRRRRDFSPLDLPSFFVYSVVFYLGLFFHLFLFVLIFGSKGPRQIQRQKQRNRALEPDLAMALSIWLLFSTVLSTVTHCRLVAISAVSSLVVVPAFAQLAVTPVSGTLLVTAQLTEASRCVKSVCTFTESIHMAPSMAIQSTYARLSSPLSLVPVTIFNRISPTLASCLLGLYADKLASNNEAAQSCHVLYGAELHGLSLSPTPSFARSGPLWPCLLPQPGRESPKGPLFPPRLDPLDLPDCASSGFSEPPSLFIKDLEPSSDDQYFFYSMTASMENRTRLGSAKARVYQHGNVGVQSCVLNNVLALPWILVKFILVSWSEVFEKSSIYMKLETTLALVYTVHLAQSRDVVLNLRPLFSQPSHVSRVCSNSIFVTCAIRFQGPSSQFVSDKSRTGILSVSDEIHLVSSESFVGARAALARYASFQALLVGLINIDSDYFMLVVVTYSGVHLMISHGSPIVEQVSLVKFVIPCFAVLLVVIKLSRIPPVFIMLPSSIAPDVIT
ncbi:hypothetical protein Bca52824_078838 [Brassica carinata]|uniref:Uncharacterized protein n=1 Tax=Brassica carinata TaxID=52824 RepID=A0A8X7TZI7_BRACI|nr:hypothetical protein Bca52824_078838 [Brassica carinata]